MFYTPPPVNDGIRYGRDQDLLLQDTQDTEIGLDLRKHRTYYDSIAAEANAQNYKAFLIKVTSMHGLRQTLYSKKNWISLCNIFIMLTLGIQRCRM